MDIKEIREYLPHRYPFLLIDRVTDLQPGEQATALKNVSVNEPFFNGHFPDEPIMPGVLIIEAMAQTAGILGFITQGKRPSDGYIYPVMRPVTPSGRPPGNRQMPPAGHPPGPHRKT